MTSISINVRFAEPSDSDNLVVLGRHTQQFHIDRAPGQFLTPNDHTLRQFFMEAIAHEAKRVMVAAVGSGLVVGYAILSIQHREATPFTSAATVAEVDQLGVRPGFEGLGIGTALTLRSIEIAQELQADSLRLSVWTFNQRAISLYERTGFVAQQLRMSYPLAADPIRVPAEPSDES